MKRLQLVAGFICMTIAAQSQVMADFSPSGNVVDGSIVIYGANNFNSKVLYENIRGIPFWRNEYQPAILYAPGNKCYGLHWIRINQVNDEVEFINSRDEINAALPAQVPRIEVVDMKDSSRIITVFRNDLEEVNVYYGNNRKPYVQELNRGPIRLLKVMNKELKQGDSGIVYKRYYFVDRPDYFIQAGNRLNRLKKLDREEILAFLPKIEPLDAYLAKNRPSLRKEEEVIQLLAIYNQ